MIWKVCSKCGNWTPLDQFSFRKDSNKYRNECLLCQNKRVRKWKNSNKERCKTYYTNSKEYKRKNYMENIEARKEWQKEYHKKTYPKNKKQKIAYVDWWRKQNPNKPSEYSKKRRSTIQGRLENTTSRSMWAALKYNKAGFHWETLVDYTVKDLIIHLESRFKDSMSWDNYGEWEIDHIIPQSYFNYSSPEDTDFKKCWSLDNLQPLWASENRSKQNRWIG